jgi:dTMP kinase
MEARRVLMTDSPKKPLFVTFEGIDACGKSTQILMLHDFLRNHGIEAVQLRDPGATRVSEAVRAILLDRSNTEMSPWTELLLYEAARAQLVQELIQPALRLGRIVLCDRFYDSTTAYQGYARNLDLKMITRANEIGACGLVPDLTFFIDVDPVVAAQRKVRQGSSVDRMEAEGLEFQKRVRAGFIAIQSAEPGRVHIIDGHLSSEQIHEKIRSLFLNKWES